MSGDAADEVVRIALEGTEVAVRLAGSGVKNLAALLVAWSKKEKKPYGKTSMMKLLKSGDELQVITLNKEQYRQFKSEARRKVLYAPFLNTKSDNGEIEMVISSKSISLVNHILKKIGYGEPAKQESEPSEEAKKNDTPSRKSSPVVPSKSKETEKDAKPKLRDSSRESVALKLEANRKYLKEQAEKKGKSKSDRSRSKKGKSKKSSKGKSR